MTDKSFSPDQQDACERRLQNDVAALENYVPMTIRTMGRTKRR